MVHNTLVTIYLTHKCGFEGVIFLVNKYFSLLFFWIYRKIIMNKEFFHIFMTILRNAIINMSKNILDYTL